MSQQVQLRHDTAANWSGVAPAPGECVVDTTNNRLLVGDGVMAGGWPAARLVESGAAIGAAGSMLKLNVLEQMVASLSGASVTAGVAIPSGALVVACAMRVVTVISGATSIAVGYSGSPTAFGSGLSISAGSTNTGMIGPNPFYAATNIVLTSAGGAFTGGAVRLSLMYLTFTPPLS